MNLERLNTTKFLKTGDRQAFAWLYLRHIDDFRTYARKLTGRYAEDLIQLTCLQVLTYDGRAKDPAEFHFKNFFCRSLHNTFIDLCRREKPTWEIPRDYAPPDWPYEEVNLKPLLSHIEKYLTPAQKQVMYLRMRGIKYKHISVIMGVSSNTARGMFRYAQITLNKFAAEILEL